MMSDDADHAWARVFRAAAWVPVVCVRCGKDLDSHIHRVLCSTCQDIVDAPRTCTICGDEVRAGYCRCIIG